MDEFRTVRLEIDANPEFGVVARSRMMRVHSRLLRRRARLAREAAVVARAQVMNTRVHGRAPAWFAQSFKE